METLFTTLTHAIEGSIWLALAAAVLWGILSIILSPCHLSSIPLIIGFVGGRGKVSILRSFVISTLFSFGILVTIAVLGVVTAAAGRMLGSTGAVGNYLVAVVFFAVGLHLLGVISIPWMTPGNMEKQKKGFLAAFILGLLFGIAVGPCTFAYMAPMLGVTFKLAASRPLYGASLLLAYGVGHCSVIVLAGTSMGLVERFLKWDANSKGTTILKTVCGILVILGGLYLIYTA